MARIPQVTRTLKTTTAKILCVDTDTEKSFSHEITLSGVFKDDKAILKRVKKEVETDTLKPIHVIESTVQTSLYGMTEQEFIKVAKILPPRGKVHKA